VLQCRWRWNFSKSRVVICKVHWNTKTVIPGKFPVTTGMCKRHQLFPQTCSTHTNMYAYLPIFISCWNMQECSDSPGHDRFCGEIGKIENPPAGIPTFGWRACRRAPVHGPPWRDLGPRPLWRVSPSLGVFGLYFLMGTGPHGRVSQCLNLREYKGLLCRCVYTQIYKVYCLFCGVLYASLYRRDQHVGCVPYESRIYTIHQRDIYPKLSGQNLNGASV